MKNPARRPGFSFNAVRFDQSASIAVAMRAMAC